MTVRLDLTGEDRWQRRDLVWDDETGEYVEVLAIDKADVKVKAHRRAGHWVRSYSRDQRTAVRRQLSEADIKAEMTDALYPPPEGRDGRKWIKVALPERSGWKRSIHKEDWKAKIQEAMDSGVMVWPTWDQIPESNLAVLRDIYSHESLRFTKTINGRTYHVDFPSAYQGGTVSSPGVRKALYEIERLATLYPVMDRALDYVDDPGAHEVDITFSPRGVGTPEATTMAGMGVVLVSDDLLSDVNSETAVIRSVSSGFWVQSAFDGQRAQVTDLQYILTHEWGHLIGGKGHQEKAAAAARKRLLADVAKRNGKDVNFMDPGDYEEVWGVSDYGIAGYPAETYAEAFVDWHINRTSPEYATPMTRELAKEAGWPNQDDPTTGAPDW